MKKNKKQMRKLQTRTQIIQKKYQIAHWKVQAIQKKQKMNFLSYYFQNILILMFLIKNHPIIQYFNIITTMKLDNNRYKSSVFYRLIFVFSKELQRYYTNPLGTLTGILIIISYFYYVPDLIKYYYPYIYRLASENIVYMVTLQSTHLICLIGGNLIYLMIYILKIPFLQKYRIIKRPWYWEQDYQKWFKLLTKTILTVAFSAIVIPIIGLTIDLQSKKKTLGMSLQTMPENNFTVYWQILFFMFIEDILSFSIHVCFHTPALYRIHKIHHQYVDIVSISGTFFHPVEYIIFSYMPAVMGFKTLAYFYPVHITTAIAWVILRLMKTVETHGGYEFTWSIFGVLPFTGRSEVHHFHHFINVGCYASFFSIWDTIFGTNQDFYQYLQDRKNGKVKDLKQWGVLKQE